MFFGLFEKRKKNPIKKPSFLTDCFGKTQNNDQDGTSFSCIDRIASEFSLLNFGVFDAKTHKKIKNHEIEKLLKHPNLEENHFIFMYQSAIDYYYCGIFWYKVRIAGKVVALFRLNSRKVTILRDPVTNKRIFHYCGHIFNDDEILYIPSRFGYSTLKSSSIFNAISPVFDTANSLNAFTNNTFANGLSGKRVIIDIEKAYPDATKEQIKSIKESFKNEYSGAENAGRPLIKKNGIEYSEIGGGSTDNRAAELSENRKFQEHEISKLFGVPEELLNVSSSTNLENVFTLFSQFAIRPLATQVQEAINELLDEEKEYFAFDYNGIMKVSLQQRVQSYKEQIQIGMLSINEARTKENLEPVEAGDNHFVFGNLMPLNDETVNAYMAKQKLALQQLQNGNNIPGSDTNTDEGDIDSNDDKNNGDHFAGGDDKQ